MHSSGEWEAPNFSYLSPFVIFSHGVSATAFTVVTANVTIPTAKSNPITVHGAMADKSALLQKRLGATNAEKELDKVSDDGCGSLRIKRRKGKQNREIK